MKAVLLAIGAAALLGAAMLVLLILALHGLAPGDVQLVVNDRVVHLHDVSQWHMTSLGVDGWLAIAAAAIALPIVLLAGVLLPLLLVVAALLLVIGLALGVGLIGMAPLLVPLLLLIWLWRRAQRRAARAAQARSASKTTIDL